LNLAWPSSLLSVSEDDPLSELWQNAVMEGNNPAILDALQYWEAVSGDAKWNIYDAMVQNVQHQVSYRTQLATWGDNLRFETRECDIERD
jgi:hypothetical protein